VDAQHIPSLWVLGRAGVENLDAATSSRLASSSYSAAPTVTAIRTELDTNSTKLANLDATVSSRLAPSGTLARVTLVDTATTLTNAPASVTPTDIWSHATRTLTSGSAPTASAVADAVWNRQTSAITTANSIGERLKNTATTSIVGNLLAQANS
jgi:hypothetical protein